MLDYSMDFRKQYKFYYSKLDEEIKNIYDRLLAGYWVHEERIAVPEVSIEGIDLAHKAILFDIPDIFYVKRIKHVKKSQNRSLIVIPDYILNESWMAIEKRRVLRHALSSVEGLFILPDRFESDIEKARFIHNQLVYVCAHHNSIGPDAEDVRGVFISGAGKSIAVAKAFKFLADRIGLRCIIVTGSVKQTRNQGQFFDHYWNAVFIDGKRFHVDVFLDKYDGKTQQPIEKYCLLSDDEMKTDHEIIPLFNE